MVKVRKIDPRKIRVPEVRVTARMSEETAEQFKASVAGVGIDEPVKVYQVGEELWLSDGLHRLQAAIANNLPSVDVIVREGTMVDVMCNNLMSGHLRGKHPVSEMRRVITELYEVHKVGIEDIRYRTGLTREYIENLLIVSQLAPLVLKALDEEKIGIGIALVLAKIKDPIEQETILYQQQLYRWSAKDVSEFVAQVQQLRSAKVMAHGPEEQAAPLTVKCYYCGQDTRLAHVANPNTCITCSQTLLIAIAQARQELAAAASLNDTIPKAT